MLNWLRVCLAAWMDGGTVKWLSGRVPLFTGWLTGLHSKSCLPLWLQCEVFHVLSAPTICFYKAAPPLHVGLFTLYPLLFSPSFPSSFFTLSYSLFISPSCFPFFPFLSVLYFPYSYLFVFWSAPSSFLYTFTQPTRPTSLSPSACPPIYLLCPPIIFSFHPPGLDTLFLPFSPPFSCHAFCWHMQHPPMMRSSQWAPSSGTTQTHRALAPSHQDKGVWGKLITDLKEAL